MKICRKTMSPRKFKAQIALGLVLGALIALNSLNEISAAKSNNNSNKQAKTTRNHKPRSANNHNERKPKSSPPQAPSPSPGAEGNVRQPANAERHEYLSNDDSSDPRTISPHSSSADELWSFNLMSSAKDRIEAVKGLLAQNNQTIGSTQQTNSTSFAPLSGQCNHKGRVYANGQPVPIQEQPCLSCTCSRSIMQCFLRVCPPIVSTESSHKKSFTEDANGLPSIVKCRMVKDPNQCCPTMKCDNSFNQTSDASSTTPSLPDDSSASPKNQSSISRLASSSLNTSNRSVSEESHHEMHGQNVTIRTTSSPSSKEDVVAPSPQQLHDPSLKDSILLITSNPIHHAQHQKILNQQQELRNNISANRYQAKPMSRYDYSSSLLDTLIESAYTNVAQMNGLNVQGSCLINGSLYVEGSAVLTEANSFCQYCYCIRQKIMCVRPKCHLYISGCKPKYGSEYACCPTSYECSSSNSIEGQPQIDGPSGLFSSANRTTTSKELVGKISIALDSISRLTQMERLHNAELLQLSKNAEEVKRNRATINSTTNEATLGDDLMGAIMKTVEESVSTQAPTTSSPEAGNKVRNEARQTTASMADNSGISERTYTNKSIEMESTPEERATDDERNFPAQKQTTPPTTTTTTSPATTTTNSDELLEPMNKLGPLMSLAQMGGAGGCLENGRHYEIGEQIPTLDRCKHCYCGLEGMKECKIVECSLKMAHDCKPVIPKDHCCPIRYDCPSTSGHQMHSSHYNSNNQHNQAHFNQNRTQLAQRNSLADSLREAMNRYRSDNMQDPSNASSPSQPDDLSFLAQCSLSLNSSKCLPPTNMNPQSPMQTSSPAPRPSPPSPANAVRNAANGLPFNWPTPTGPLELIPGLSDYTPTTDPTPGHNRSAGEPRSIDSPAGTEYETGTSSSMQPQLTATDLNQMLDNFTQGLASNGNSNFELNNNVNNNNNNNESTTVPNMMPITTAANRPPSSPNFDQINQSHPTSSMQTPAANMTNLAEDLNKFIMNIDGQQAATTRAPLSPLAVHNQQPRMAADYHSVQAEPETISHNNNNNAQSQPQIVGIPSIEPELIGNLPRTDHLSIINGAGLNRDEDTLGGERNLDRIQHAKLTESSVEYATSPSWQRDSRSTMMPSNAVPGSSINTIGDGANTISYRELNPEFRESETNNDEYLDDNRHKKPSNSGHSDSQVIPRMRLSPLSSNAANNIATAENSSVNKVYPNWNAPLNSPTTSHVIFDDDTAHNSNNFSSWSPASISRSSADTSNETRRSDSSSNYSDPQIDSTPTPPQPRNGTPIGMVLPSSEIESAKEKGWFQSITGFMNNFGRRLNANKLAKESSEPVGSYVGDFTPTEQATGRSTGKTMFKQLIEKLLVGSSGESYATGRSMSDGGDAKELVMRPLEIAGDQPRSSDSVSASDSTSELVTSSVPFIESASINDTPESRSSREFAHRSESVDASSIINSKIDEKQADEIITSSEFSTTTNSGENNERMMLTNDQLSDEQHQSSGLIGSDARVAATCIDPLTNITYQSGEKMPKNDSCMVCTCVSGEPLCSPLVCPPKPAENCYEDKGAHVGECCPSYVCADNVSQLRNNRDQTTPRSHETQSPPEPRSIEPQKQHNPRMMNQILNQNLLHSNQRPLMQANNFISSNIQLHQYQKPVTSSELSKPNDPPINRQLQQQQHHQLPSPNMQRPEVKSLADSRVSFPHNIETNNLSKITNYNQNRSPIRIPIINPISRTDLIRSLPTHLRYQPQKSAPILPNLVQMPSFSSPSPISRFGIQHNNNNILFPGYHEANAMNKLDGPIMDNHMMQPMQNSVLKPDLAMNRQIVGHPARRLVTNPDIGPQIMMSNSDNNQRSVWWNSVAKQNPTVHPITEDPISIEQRIGASTSKPNQAQVIDTNQLVSNESKFSPSANAIDPSGFRPVPAPASGLLSMNSPNLDALSISSSGMNQEEQSPLVSQNTTTSNAHMPFSSTTTTQSTLISDTNEEVISDNPFQVSKCDVSGRLYNIGESIESLSNRCKHCVCTPIGVDCQTRLC